MTMSDEAKDLEDGEIAYCANYVDEGDGPLSMSWVRSMALEIQRRRAANRAAREEMEKLAREMATMYATMVPELRWDEQSINQIYEKISPAARMAYDECVEARARHAGFHPWWRTHLSNRRGVSTEVLLQAMAKEESLNADLERCESRAAVVIPEVVALINRRQQAFDDAKRKEKP
jgi:hypothetical protein